jgi:DnaK suppressor protein
MNSLDISYFKNLLQNQKAQILSNLDKAKGELNGLKGMDVKDEIDFASVSTDNMIDNTISENQMRELEEIEMAFKKISNGTYGVCEMCGEPIKVLRLKVKPFARYCIYCREVSEKIGK